MEMERRVYEIPMTDRASAYLLFPKHSSLPSSRFKSLTTAEHSRQLLSPVTEQATAFLGVEQMN